MSQTRHTVERIAEALRQHSDGMAIDEIARRYAISKQTFYRWKRKYAGMSALEMRRLKQLEIENRKLKKLVADLSDIVSGRI